MSRHFTLLVLGTCLHPNLDKRVRKRKMVVIVGNISWKCLAYIIQYGK